MTHPEGTHGRKSGGPWAGGDLAGPGSPGEAARYQTVPPDERQEGSPAEGTAPVVRTLVVRDESGRVVSVTKVAPDARFGVGVKPPPGHTVTELEAGTLARDPFAHNEPGEQSQT